MRSEHTPVDLGEQRREISDQGDRVGTARERLDHVGSGAYPAVQHERHTGSDRLADGSQGVQRGDRTIDLPPAATTVVVVVCAVLVFVPIGYLYPSRATDFRRSGLGLGALWAGASLVLLLQLPRPSRALALVTLLYIVYYFAVSLVLTARRRRGPA